VNENYAAEILPLKNINTDLGLNTLNGVVLRNYQALIDKSHQEGELGVLFTAETKLSEEFCRKNNLHRHADLNEDQSVTGYIEDHRRVRAIKLGGQRSDAFWLPLTSLEWTGVDIAEFKEGDLFDHLDGKLICEKHVVPVKGSTPGKPTVIVKSRVEEKIFPLHFSTDNYFRNADKIDPLTQIVVTAKTHGTSVRIANIPVQRKLSRWERIAAKFGAKIQKTEYAMVYGSRNTTKDANAGHLSKYFDSDVWVEVGKQLDGLLPENWIVYGEIIGWSSPEKPVQKGYSYNLPKGTAKLQVYRISAVNSRGVAAELSWDALVEFCKSVGVGTVAELWRGRHCDFDPQAFMDKRFHELGYTQCEPLEKGTKKAPIVDEGVVVRAEGLRPLLLKAKSPLFLGLETKLLDAGEVDLESAESAEGSAA
jgi:hypothetical protein